MPASANNWPRNWGAGRAEKSIMEIKRCKWNPRFCRIRGACQIGAEECRKKESQRKRKPYEVRKVRIKDLVDEKMMVITSDKHFTTINNDGRLWPPGSICPETLLTVKKGR